MYLVRIPKMITGFLPEYIWKVKSHQIALTFDDGPHLESTPQLLQILSEANCPATHFLLGKQIDLTNFNVESYTQQGHTIGHHSYQHLNGWSSPNDVYLKDIEEGYLRVQTNLYRPPYGKITPNQWTELKELYPDMVCCQFNFMPGDFDEKADTVLLKNRMSEVRGGDIVVLHDRPACFEKYAPFLKDWIADMRGKGLSFVTL